MIITLIFNFKTRFFVKIAIVKIVKIRTNNKTRSNYNCLRSNALTLLIKSRLIFDSMFNFSHLYSKYRLFIFKYNETYNVYSTTSFLYFLKFFDYAM